MSKDPTQYELFGPFDIPYDSPGKGTSKRIDDDQIQQFWSQPYVRSLAHKQGCYIFALASSGGHMPWYVGKTNKDFASEAFHTNKIKRYNSVMFRGRKGKPVMFFIAKPGGARAMSKAHANDMETFFIQCAIAKNPELKNKHKTKLPNWGVRGVLRGGPGRPPVGASQFKRMMRL